MLISLCKSNIFDKIIFWLRSRGRVLTISTYNVTVTVWYDMTGTNHDRYNLYVRDSKTDLSNAESCVSRICSVEQII